ncbi:MAG: DMT family transporter [Ancalomicrobiaceae bacterium]|nr:DMT family transporter [Ancalomicrobiaceae bacterium]
MTPSAKSQSYVLYAAAAFGAGCLLTAMLKCNADLAHSASALFASFAAHGIGLVAATLILLALRQRPWRAGSANAGAATAKIPLWAYFGGFSGAATVMATSIAANSALGLAGTLALGLAGQLVFSLAADMWGLMGLKARKLSLYDLAALALIGVGSLTIILEAGAGT